MVQNGQMGGEGDKYALRNIRLFFAVRGLYEKGVVKNTDKALHADGSRERREWKCSPVKESQVQAMTTISSKRGLGDLA